MENVVGVAPQPAVAVATTDKPKLAASLLLGVGGIVTLIGSLLAWFQLSGGSDRLDLKGTDFSAGVGAAGLGVLVALAGIVMFLRAGRSSGKGWSIVAIVAASFVLIIGLYAAFSPESAIPSLAAEDVATAISVSETQAEAILEQWFATGALSATSQVGAYVVAAGAAAALAGGILGVRRSRKAA